MNFGVVLLLIISGWGLLSIVVTLGLGEIVKTRDRVIERGSPFPASDREERQTDRAKPHSQARRSA
jgi:hypothetical protein